MATISKKRSLADIQPVDSHEEFRTSVYGREVLQLEDLTEEAFDELLTKDAAALGINTSPPSTKPQNGHTVHTSLCESADTVVSRHARTGSSGSQASASTGMSSRSSDDSPTIGATTIPRRRSSGRKSVSFSDYDKFLLHSDKQQSNGHGFERPLPPVPAPSIFSVSTRKSYNSIKNSIKGRFRLRRTNLSTEDLK